MKTCAQCKYYTGMGDWDICCRKREQRLCHENTFANDCQSFKQTTVCRNVSSYVGRFRCPICGYFCQEDSVENTYPDCGSIITGALWEGQKHYREKKDNK